MREELLPLCDRFEGLESWYPAKPERKIQPIWISGVSWWVLNWWPWRHYVTRNALGWYLFRNPTWRLSSFLRQFVFICNCPFAVCIMSEVPHPLSTWPMAKLHQFEGTTFQDLLCGPLLKSPGVGRFLHVSPSRGLPSPSAPRRVVVILLVKSILAGNKHEQQGDDSELV